MSPCIPVFVATTIPEIKVLISTALQLTMLPERTMMLAIVAFVIYVFVPEHPC
jgi:hypothetical protein